MPRNIFCALLLGCAHPLPTTTISNHVGETAAPAPRVIKPVPQPQSMPYWRDTCIQLHGTPMWRPLPSGGIQAVCL